MRGSLGSGSITFRDVPFATASEKRIVE